MSNDFCYEFPVVRGQQAGRIFYMATVPMRVVQNMFKLDTGDGSALSRSQREVNLTRAKKFADYLKQNKSSFVLPALTGFVNVDPDMSVEFKESNIPNVGMLSVPMDAALLFVDGQHRASGVAIAMEDSDTRLSLGAHSAPVMLFESLTLEERQSMFSDINGNVAKPAQALSDTYNNRDELAIFAKEIAATIPQFIGMVDFERNVVSAKSGYLFSIKTIKEVSATVAGLKKNQIPSDEDKALITRFWQSWFDKTQFSEKLASFNHEAQQFKERTIISTGVVMKAAAMAVREAGLDNIDFTPLGSMDWSRDNNIFHGRCVDPKLRTMKADANAVKLTAAKLLSIMQVKLKDRLADIEEKVYGQAEQQEEAVQVFKPEDNLITEPEVEAFDDAPGASSSDTESKWQDWRSYINMTPTDAKEALNFACNDSVLPPFHQDEASDRLSQVSGEFSYLADRIKDRINNEHTDEELERLYYMSIRDLLLSLGARDPNEARKTLINIRMMRREIESLTCNLSKK
ncbi:DNA sulfur modification protein DndB [Vibrio metschnikovii]|nr:DNA sulfur modification protein DndB [Vibrio metschnikovii]